MPADRIYWRPPSRIETSLSPDCYHREMKIKGSAVLARKHIITRQFGESEWAEFFKEMTSDFALFARPVLATSVIPLPDFLSFHDKLMSRFFGRQLPSYVSLGEQCARWAVTDGPYRSFIADRDFHDFVEFFPCTWRTYFLETSSYCTTKVDGCSIEFEAFDLPRWHPYFEHFVVGYFKGALEVICANPIQFRQVQGGSGTHYKYSLWAGPTEQLVEPLNSVNVVETRCSVPDLEKIVAFIDEHLNADVALSDMARLVDYSPDYLARLFKASFGVPPHQYVLRRRIERAKGLLLDRGRSIAEVAHACGFATQSHFTSVFKSRLGITPAAYRLGSKSK
jgi:AraC-like DNA-binding protein